MAFIVFIISALIIVMFSAIFIYMGSATETKLKETFGNMDFHTVNSTNQTISDTFGRVNISYNTLYWGSVVLMVGMMIGILVGSFLVRTHPIFFIPYLFGLIISIIVAVSMSNAYETLMSDGTLGATLSGFTGANFILLNLPVIIAVIGIIGAIIMFGWVGKKSEQII